MKHAALAHRKILVDDGDRTPAGERAPQRRDRVGAQQPRPHQPGAHARVAQAVDGVHGPGGERADHEKHDFRVIAAVTLDRVVPPAEALRELGGDAVVNLQCVLRRQMRFVAEVRIGRAAEHRDCLAGWPAGAKADAARFERRQEFGCRFGRRKLYRLARERKVETVQVDDRGQPHCRFLGKPVGQQHRVDDFLAGGAMHLQESRIARRQHVVVVRLERDRAREPARHVDQHERHAPARHRVEHLHRVEQPLARGGGEYPHAGGRGGSGRRDHGMLGFEHHQPAAHLAGAEPLRQQLDDFGLRRDRKSGHVVGPREARAPRRCGIAGEKPPHGAAPAGSRSCATRSGIEWIACGGQTLTQIMQPLQCCRSISGLRSGRTRIALSGHSVEQTQVQRLQCA